MIIDAERPIDADASVRTNRNQDKTTIHKAKYSESCIQRSPLGQRKSGLIRQVTS